MKKYLILFLVLCGFSTYAQINILNADQPEDIGKLSKEHQDQLKDNDYLRYPYIDDKDVMWSKIVYEEIDLSEKFNHPLYYPMDGLYNKERRSLWATIKEAILAGKIENIYYDNTPNFNERMDRKTYLGRIKTVEEGVPINQSSDKIVSYKIKGIWYVDKRIGELKYRLLGIMPKGRDMNNSESVDPIDLFWLWYKDLRPILHDQLVFDDRNNVSRVTFDQLLTSRRFTARIYAIDNVMDDRGIDQYVDDPFMQLIESERLKTIIRDFEQDLWAY